MDHWIKTFDVQNLVCHCFSLLSAHSVLMKNDNFEESLLLLENLQVYSSGNQRKTLCRVNLTALFKKTMVEMAQIVPQTDRQTDKRTDRAVENNIYRAVNRHRKNPRRISLQKRYWRKRLGNCGHKMYIYTCVTWIVNLFSCRNKHLQRTLNLKTRYINKRRWKRSNWPCRRLLSDRMKKMRYAQEMKHLPKSHKWALGGTRVKVAFSSHPRDFCDPISTSAIRVGICGLNSPPPLTNTHTHTQMKNQTYLFLMQNKYTLLFHKWLRIERK